MFSSSSPSSPDPRRRRRRRRPVIISLQQHKTTAHFQAIKINKKRPLFFFFSLKTECVRLSVWRHLIILHTRFHSTRQYHILHTKIYVTSPPVVCTKFSFFSFPFHFTRATCRHFDQIIHLFYGYFCYPKKKKLIEPLVSCETTYPATE